MHFTFRVCTWCSDESGLPKRWFFDVNLDGVRKRMFSANCGACVTFPSPHSTRNAEVSNRIVHRNCMSLASCLPQPRWGESNVQSNTSGFHPFLLVFFPGSLPIEPFLLPGRPPISTCSDVWFLRCDLPIGLVEVLLARIRSIWNGSHARLRSEARESDRVLPSVRQGRHVSRTHRTLACDRTWKRRSTSTAALRWTSWAEENNTRSEARNGTLRG